MRMRGSVAVVCSMLAVLFVTDAAQAYFHPGTGRFISRDPIGITDGPNEYAYVRNQVTIAVDAFGLKAYIAIYYVNAQTDAPGSFKRAAETWAAGIKSNPDFDPECDIVLLYGITKAKEYESTWSTIDQTIRQRMAAAPKYLKTKDGENGEKCVICDERIAALHVFTHASKKGYSGIELAGGTVGEKEIKKLPVLPWAPGGLLSLHGCNTGLKHKEGGPSVAEMFEDQGVSVEALAGYGYFSTDPDKYSEIDKDGPSENVYLRCYRRGLNAGYLGGSGAVCEEKTFAPKKQP